jgi:hypothetical protein
MVYGFPRVRCAAPSVSLIGVAQLSIDSISFLQFSIRRIINNLNVHQLVDTKTFWFPTVVRGLKAMNQNLPALIAGHMQHDEIPHVTRGSIYLDKSYICNLSFPGFWSGFWFGVASVDASFAQAVACVDQLGATTSIAPINFPFFGFSRLDLLWRLVPREPVATGQNHQQTSWWNCARQEIPLWLLKSHGADGREDHHHNDQHTTNDIHNHILHSKLLAAVRHSRGVRGITLHCVIVLPRHKFLTPKSIYIGAFIGVVACCCNVGTLTEVDILGVGCGVSCGFGCGTVGNLGFGIKYLN